MKTIVCHITSAHPADDIRIFHKECASLVAHGYEVHLVAQGRLPSDAKGVIHHPIPLLLKKERIGKMIFRARQAYQIAKQTKAALFHFHDPELLPFGLLLKWQGNIVIYDAHEDVPRDIMTKRWIPRYFRKAIAWLVEKVENFIARRLDATIAATPFICRRFQAIGADAIDIKNYARVMEFDESLPVNNLKNTCPAVCYVGLISEERGIVEMVRAIEELDVRLIIAGSFINKKTEDFVRSLKGWEKVDYRGIVSREGIGQIFAESLAGLCILHPSPTYSESLPIKLFEYMAVGLPVLISNFATWKNIIDTFQCGVCVDPLNSEEVKRGIEWIIQNNSQSEAMGRRGSEAVKENYTWDAEAECLISFYRKLFQGSKWSMDSHLNPHCNMAANDENS